MSNNRQRPKQVPQKLWDFFDSEKGLSTEQLLNAISIKQAVYRFNDLGQTFGMIKSFRSCTYDLIKFYRDQKELSVDDLLQYDAYAIRDLAVHDKGFAFHLWLINNKLCVPSVLVNHGWGEISTICCESGIEYLNRKIITLPSDERSAKLDEFIKLGRHLMQKDIELVLADSVVAEHEVGKLGTFNHRFVAYRNKRIQRENMAADSVTKNGRHSLLWQAAKVVAQSPNLSTIQFIDDCRDVVSAAHAFNNGK